MSTTMMDQSLPDTDYTPLVQSVWCSPSWGAPVPVSVSSPARPIRLTLREVECLREAAARDPALRCILEKFTAQIEVTVTFEDR